MAVLDEQTGKPIIPRPVPHPVPAGGDRGALPQFQAPPAPSGTGFHVVSIGPNPLAGFAPAPTLPALRGQQPAPDQPPPSMPARKIDESVVSGPANVKSEIIRQAKFYKVPSALALAVANQESGLNQAAVSPAGAIGIFQLMPATASGLHVDPTDWRQNIKGGLTYLRMQYEHFGNWTQALAAYNAGPGAVESGAWKGYGETTRYVQNVTSTAAKIANGALNLGPGFSGTVKISAPLPGNPDVTSGYGPRGSSSGVPAEFHYGVDLAAPQGTPIHAMIGGTVQFAGPYGTGGNTVIIKDAQGRLWYYHHMVNLPLVKTGQKVAPGLQIGNVGMTGLATGPHLHLGLQVDGKWANPTGVIQKAFKIGWDKTGNTSVSGLDLASPGNGGPDLSGGPVIAGQASTTTAQALSGGRVNPALENIPVPEPQDLPGAARTPGVNGQAPTQTPAAQAAAEALQHVQQSGAVSPELQALMQRSSLISAYAPGRTG